MNNSKCKICRRLGMKLFLKGERCFSPKCAMVKRDYPPGEKRKRKGERSSEYGKEMREKQKLKNLYHLKEVQLRNYIRRILKKKGRAEDASAILIRNLELRLDNVVFRLGFSSSRSQARQLVSHGFFLVNGKTINFPSKSLKKGDIVSLKPLKMKKNIFKDIENSLKKQKTPSWLELDIKKMEGKVIAVPTLEEVAPPVEISSIFEYYSR